MNGNEAYDTYTVYDDYGNVRFVLPPPAADGLTEEGLYDARSAILQIYAYIYRYDKYNRCIYKKLPGCAPVYTIYDVADRPIFTQDGEQRDRNEWSFSIPDGFGRVVLSGICKNQPAYDAESCPLDTVVVKAVWANEANSLKGYRLEGITLSSPTVLSVTYYDTYDFLGKNGIPDDTTTAYCETAGYGKRYGDDCKGQQTGILTARFTDREPAGFIYSTLYYDDRYRVIQRKGNNGQNGTESVYTAYNFEGSPTKEKHVHCVPGQAPVTEVHTYTYDLASRLLRSVYQLNDNAPVTLVDNVYDEVGRLLVDKRNGVPELRTNYSYNLRSWLKGVSSPLFSQTLNYQETTNDIAPCYNGNISSMLWRTAQNNASYELVSSPEKGYSFTYDGLSRLKDAVYGEGTSLNQNRNRFNEQITGYDKMGNILGLLRYGQTGTDSYGLIDNLNLTYNGNQLQSVYDNATNSVFGNGMEFKNNANERVEYAYDKNGNLIKDLNKNITEIQYNILNLPGHIIFADGNSIVYEYAADGSKVCTTHTINDNVTSTVYCGNAVYENGSLKMLLNESGYYSFQDNKFHFYIKDHQGNVRVVADETGKVDEVNDYYPFGGLMSNTCNNVQPYKYNGKELDRKGGLDWYDHGARMYDATLGRFMKTDRFSEKYASLSPYQYGANNPVNNIDINGDSIAVLNLGYGSSQHLAILIQNDRGKWQYFSVNGDNVFSSGKHKGGRMFDDLGEHSFNSPEEFMNSEYNKEGNKEDENISNYHFSSAYILPTNKKQDGIIRDEFIRISEKEEYSLNVLSPNHCATTVQRSLQKAGIDTKSDIFVPVNSGIGQMIHLRTNPYLPSDAYRAIKQNNPKGYELKIR